MLPDDQQEDLSDLQGPKDWTSGVALWSTDWTAETVIRQLEKGNINMNPNWQRRGAWRDDRQSKFIESLVLGLPVPQIILAEHPDQRGRFIVIDGKQRLITLWRFGGEKPDELFSRLVLKGLDERPDLNGLTINEMQDDPIFHDDIANFENQSIRTVVIKNWDNEKYLYSVFLRINTGSVQLSPQELRQALSPGPFSNFVDQFSADSQTIQNMLGLTEPDFRMRDAEMLLRFLAYHFFWNSYGGNLKQFLDDATSRLNHQWDWADRKILQASNQLEAAIEFTSEIFGRAAMRKWNGEKFERTLNRAVFDIMTAYFARPEVRSNARDKQNEIVRAFKDLCESNRDFLASLESTTKSIDANAVRFGVWAKTLSDITGKKVQPFVFERK